MKICSLASGSKGNCLYVETGETRVLIDAGMSLRETVLRMEGCGLDPVGVHAVLVTHEHIDHIRSAGSFARKFKVPVVASHLVRRKAEHYFKKTQVLEFESGSAFSFRDLRIDPFPITHDACDPVGYVLESREGCCGSATDLGVVTRLVMEKLRGCRCLNLESNHDVEMLMNGPYPWELKQRIKSRHGHLSNVESLELLHELAHDGLEALVMAHLSEVNNHPDHVVATTRSFLADQNICAPSVVIGDQYKASAVLEI
ncbi:MBL fold metallo-hydrolase [Geobacter sp. SVR]|uniref:MBL fold metallo-hydrolase n=1 Tax=Geobacter sp. SVR TaxID=2495594 RepID=UPI00143EFC7E|nr:MBL fold metallo-hydrolase [Geobacter sp. SVR]BCS54674.1 MBL fold metallo-hydrolase [Geobacter sp. SVR]GCF87614.1 MBL fold metallo-hydrolase [Geobacter sp. SVR]